MTGIKIAVYAILCGAVITSLVGVSRYKKLQRENSRNFQANYKMLPGWVSEPHGPTTLFRYADPKTNLIIKGAINQVVDEVNPTPDMDTDGIAQYYVDRTKQSMPAWTATELDNYKVGPAQFSVVRRSSKDRIVITAYLVKGNTTLLITLFGKGKTRPYVDPNTNKLYRFLDTVSLNERDMSSL